uniref:MARVEL domain-containing protein n=1 Tax=Heterorhabditis bacteriophora TaxID=37862 RepID=A0A1I7XW07_HETBA
MAFISALSATVLLHLHVAYKKNWILDWASSTFTYIMWINALLAIAAAIAMTGCLIAAGIKQQTLTHEG